MSTLRERLPASEARKRFSDVVSRAHFAGEPTIIERSGKAVAVVVSMEDFEAMEALEDLMDTQEAERRLKAVREGRDEVMSAEDFHRELDAEREDAAKEDAP